MMKYSTYLMYKVIWDNPFAEDKKELNSQGRLNNQKHLPYPV